MMEPKELLLYWIKERYDILQKRKNGVEKPWSDDEIFRRTYFCNVRREDDTVTLWIRNHYSPLVSHPMFEYNIVLSRFLNWPPTLGFVEFQKEHDPDLLLSLLEERAVMGYKVWGGAYVITTHGIPMKKDRYLTHRVLEQTSKALEHLRAASTCQGMAHRLQGIEGIGSFLAGQIVADLKNTVGHTLYTAGDRKTFVMSGPGSARGLGWFMYGDPKKGSTFGFSRYFPLVREYVDAHWPEGVPTIDNQDLQNCLCEYDKFMRVRNGTGRSKRGYNGY